jgi:succinoglycan biosynthesis protein ExoO
MNDPLRAPEVSVVIAAYNVEATIERALRSALDQEGVAVEIIVVNDDSTDGTRAAVSGIDDPRVKIIDCPANAGPGAARNAGIAAAAAPWIAILDGDDALRPDRLARCLTRARLLKADIVVDNIETRREADGAVFPMFPPEEFGRFSTLNLARFIAGNIFFHGRTLGYLKPVFSAAFLRAHGLAYETDLRIGEDYLFLATALAEGALCAVESSMGYLYTMRKGSTSHRLSCDDVERLIAGDRKFLARTRLDPAAGAAQKKRTASLREMHAFMQLVDAIKRRDAKSAWRAFITHPLAARHLSEAVEVRIAQQTQKMKKHARRLMPTTAEDLQKRKTVLLFYKEYECDSHFKGDRYLKRILRPLYHLTHRRQKKTGFAVSFDLMRRALEKAGYEVRANDYRTARRNPEYPVGAVGFPSLLENWTLPNPAVLGPSLYDHPQLRPDLFSDARFRKYAVLAPWTMDMFRPVYGERCFSWFAGLDLDEWPDLSGRQKIYDFLVYDKIYRDYEAREKNLIAPLLHLLDEKGLTYRRIRYKMYDHATYRELLAGARGMLFLCEHETQGLAYQEAMASGVPVLAWNPGLWADPIWKKFASEPPPASSVPFFSAACGETFRNLTQFEDALARFMSRRSSYRPRDYVARNLNMETSAKLYADAYFGVAGK